MKNIKGDIMRAFLIGLVICVITCIIAVGGYIGGIFFNIVPHETIELLPTQSPLLLKGSLAVRGEENKSITLGSGNTHLLFERKKLTRCTLKDDSQLFKSIGGLTIGKPCTEFTLTIEPEEVRYLKYFKKILGSPKTFIIASYDESTAISSDVNVQLLRMDPYSDMPQILVSAYSGGAHCCESSSLIIRSKYKNWHVLELPDRDGDLPLQTIVNSDGVPVFAFHDDSFLYKYGSYADSILPLKLLALRKGRLMNVTAQKGYRDILMNDFKSSRGRAAPYCLAIQTINNYDAFLAYYVAYFALLGHLQEAWAYMLLHQDSPDDKAGDFAVGESGDISKFPSILKEHLVKEGYITASMAAKLPLETEKLPREMKAKYADIGSLFQTEPDLMSIPLSCKPF